MKTVVLIGMMGSGKSTIGKLLAEKLSIKFFDIDTEIEKENHKTISEIFSQNGETYFREIEKNLTQQFLKNNYLNAIISTGGGAFENEETRNFLLKNATVIYLKTSSNEIFERIKTNTSRPLLKNNMTIEKITEIIENREANYKQAHHTISTDKKTPTEIINEILGVL